MQRFCLTLVLLLWCAPLLAVDADRSSPVKKQTVKKQASKVAKPTGHARKPLLKPLAGRVWYARYVEYQKRRKALKPSATAEERFLLGKWSYDQRLEDEAWEQWVTAVRRNPDHARTRTAMGFVRMKSKWVRPGQVNRDWIRQVDADQRAFSFTIAIQDDANDEFFHEFRWRLRRLNWFLWDITEGQMYLKNIRVVDNSSQGRFIIQKGKLRLPLLQGGGAFCMRAGRPEWRVVSGGRCYVRILCHEFFHGIFGLPDERHGCPCLMQGGLYGVRTTELSLCDDKTHRQHAVTPLSCWKIVSKRYPKMRHPNKIPYGRVPQVRVSVVDTKPKPKAAATD